MGQRKSLPFRTFRCKDCGKDFEAKRVDARWCSDCKGIRRRETYRRYDAHAKHVPCPRCGKPRYRRNYRDPAKTQLCWTCYTETDQRSREKNGNWRGGRTKNKQGYVSILQTRPGRKNRYNLEHILVWEEANGRLPDQWVVHHLNGIKDDNRIENLLAMPREMHATRQMFEPYEKRIRELEESK